MSALSMTANDLKKRINALKEKKTEKQSTESFSSVGFRASVDMIAGVLMGIFLGYLAERYFLPPPWGMLSGFIVGSAAGFMNVYRLTKRYAASEAPQMKNAKAKQEMDE